MKNIINISVPVILIVLNFVLLACCQDGNDRLSGETYPLEYTILVKTQTESPLTFDGEIAIRIGVVNATYQIILSANELANYTFNEIELFEIDEGTETSIIVDYTWYYNYNYLSLWARYQALSPEKEYIVKINYIGVYQEDQIGMYKSVTDVDEEVIVIATNFLPQYASYVFPCYDDPQFRVKVTLSIEHPVGYRALSMTASEISTNSSAEITTTRFHTTPNLSIHTLAFTVVNDKYYKMKCSEESISICIYYDDQHTEEDVSLVTDVTALSINELQNYLGVVLDLPKLDIVAVPPHSHYMAGSHGLLINDQRYIYFNPNTSGLVHKDEVIRHTIRQVASLYFGNMVAVDWWDDFWLIQGLSVLFEYIIADKLYPEFDEMNQFLSKLYESGFIEDVVIPSELIIQFPSLLVSRNIEYKSAGILYMFKNIVSDNVFQLGLLTILVENSPLINSDQFFSILTNFAIENNILPRNYDLNSVMRTWLTQTRYPLVGISRSYLPVDYESMRIYQQDIQNVTDVNEPSESTWWIPYTCINQLDLISSRTRQSIHWLENIVSANDEEGFGGEIDEYTWILCNTNQFGFYVMDYDSTNYRLLANQLSNDHTKIPAMSRAQLLHDGLLTAQHQHNSLSLIFQLSNYIDREDTYTAVNTFINQFMYFATQVYGTDPYENVLKFMRLKIAGAYDRVRSTQENLATKNLLFNDEKLRDDIINMACFSGYENCLNDMNALLKETVSDHEAMEIYQLSQSNELRYGMVLGDENLFWKVVALGDEFDKIIISLAYVRDNKLLDDLFRILSTSNSKKIDGIIINISAENRARILRELSLYNLPALDKTFEFMIERSTVVKELLNDNFISISEALSEATKTKERLEKLHEFVQLYLTSSTYPQLATADKNVVWCSNRIREFEGTLNEILDNAAAMMTVPIVLLLSLLVFGQLFHI